MVVEAVDVGEFALSVVVGAVVVDGEVVVAFCEVVGCALVVGFSVVFGCAVVVAWVVLGPVVV